MKRFGAVCALVIGIVVVQSCGGGSPPAPAAPAADATEVEADAAGGPIKRNIIWMTKNDGQTDESIDAPCLGTVSAYRVRAQRKQRVRWYVRNDQYNPCPNLDEDQVEVRFTKAVLSEQPNAEDPPVQNVKAMNGRINARVHVDETTAPDSIEKYLVYYMNKKASPDPELDINGDCGGCGPGS